MYSPPIFVSMEDSERGEAEYLIYEVIRQHQRLDQDLPKTDFHKRAFLTKKELEEAGVDVTLPVYWYEHGIMVDFEEVLTDFFQFERHRYESRSGTKAVLDDDVSHSEFGIADEVRERISDVAQQIAREYRNIFDTSVAKDKTYERFADNDFIIHLNDLRYHLQDLEGVDSVAKDEYAPTDVSISDVTDVSHTTKDAGIDEDTQETLLTYLDKMIETYPEEKYTHMHPPFLEWESLTRQFIYNGMLSELDNFTSEFWNIFSQVELRIHHNEDISDVKILQWKRERDEHIERFEKKIEQRQQVLLENREPTNELESVSEAYSESVDEAVRDLRTEQ
jgi:hypothetical protein